jgi:hypothetical protein
MSSLPLFDAAGRRRSPATLPGYHAGREPRNKGRTFPADPPTVDEIVAVMRRAGDGRHGLRARALIVVLWRSALRNLDSVHCTIAYGECPRAANQPALKPSNGPSHRQLGASARRCISLASGDPRDGEGSAGYASRSPSRACASLRIRARRVASAGITAVAASLALAVRRDLPEEPGADSGGSAAAGAVGASPRTRGQPANTWCAYRTTIPPSPTALATRLDAPERTSPAANTPGRTVSRRCGSRSGSGQQRCPSDFAAPVPQSR